MRQPILTASLLVAACGLLTACDLFKGEPDDSAIDESNVSGEVLEGTISDDMLPLDQLRSAAPHAVESGASGSAASPTETATDTASEPAGDSTADEAAEADTATAADEAAN